MPNQPLARPTPPVPTTPEVRFPTPNVEDVIIVEDVPVQRAGASPVVYGAPHPTKSTAKLVWQGPHRSGTNHVVTRRIYATARGAQDAYNLSQQYVEQSASHPIYIRTSIELRSTYTPGAIGSALGAVTALSFTAGSGKTNGQQAITFSGGGGSGATGTAEVIGGAIVSVQLTNGGTGYTSAPSASVAGGGTGAVTAYLQTAGTVTLLTVTAAGSGYTGTPTLSFSGGGGSGATAEPIISTSGTLIGAIITNPGTGYTSAPNVTVSGGGGSGATVTASIFPVLVREEYRPAEGELGSLFLVVTRVYRSTTGPALAGQRLDQRTGFVLDVIRQEVPAGTLIGRPPAGTVSIDIEPLDSALSRRNITRYPGGSGTSFPAVIVDEQWNDEIRGNIYEVEVEISAGDALAEIGSTLPVTIAGAATDTLIIDRRSRPLSPGRRIATYFCVLKVMPDPWLERPSRGFAYPAIFDFLVAGGEATSLSEFNRPGVVFDRESARSGAHPTLLVHIFTNGRPAESFLPDKFQVHTPGVASSVFNIPQNCVHPAFSVYDSDGTPREIIPASIPPTYRKDQTICLDVDSQLWRGTIHHTRIWWGNESGFGHLDPEDPVFRFSSGMVLAASADGVFKQINSLGYLVSTSTNGGFVVSGRGGGENNTETILAGSYGPVLSANRYKELFSVRHGSRAAEDGDGTVNLSEFYLMREGRAAVIELTYGGVPTDGQTLTVYGSFTDESTSPVTVNYSTVTYTFRKPGQQTIIFPEGGGGSLVGAGAASYFRMVMGTDDHYFWFYNTTTGTATDPEPGGIGHPISFATGDDTLALVTAAAAVISAVSAGWGFALNGSNTNSVTIVPTRLGTAAWSQDAGAAFTFDEAATTGTADAANQIRTAYNTDGTEATVADIYDYIARAFDLDGTAGTHYGTGTAENPYFSAVASASGVTLTGRVPCKLAYTFGGTGSETATVTTTSQNGTRVRKIADESAAKHWYLEQNLRNENYRLNIPANASALPTEAFERQSTTDTWQLKYRMDGEVSLTYEYWNGTTWATGATPLPVSAGDDYNEVDLGETTTKIRALITNSASVAKRLSLIASYASQAH